MNIGTYGAYPSSPSMQYLPTWPYNSPVGGFSPFYFIEFNLLKGGNDYHRQPLPVISPQKINSPQSEIIYEFATPATAGVLNSNPSVSYPEEVVPSQYRGILANHGRVLKQCPEVPTPHISKESFNVGYYVPSSVEPGDPFGGLQEIWKNHFRTLFDLFINESWVFGPTEAALPSTKWRCFKDFGKVRFLCQTCRHGWTSMHGVVMFYYRYDVRSAAGEVNFLLPGQKCSKCQTSNFETPMWYPEEAKKVMTNLYYTIASMIYNYDTPPLIKERRHGRPRQQHISKGCQGCQLGICKPASLPVQSLQTN